MRNKGLCWLGGGRCAEVGVSGRGEVDAEGVGELGRVELVLLVVRGLGVVAEDSEVVEAVGLELLESRDADKEALG